MATPPRPERETPGQAPAARFGALVRERREALGLRQDDVALATGVGRRFIIDLEAGKPTCQLGKALLVAEAVGLRLFDLIAASDRQGENLLPALPEPLDAAAMADDLPPPEDE
jgi:y4mF family transcriptional regulator